MNLRSPRFLLGLALCLVTGSCGVHRQLLIDTEPQGARVFMDHEDIGVTPIQLDYEYGGVREFLILHEEGDTKYSPVRLRQDTSDFMLDQFPFDVFTRVAPIRVEAEVKVAVVLQASQLVDQVMADEEGYVGALLGRADAMRERARRLQNEGEPEAPPFLAPETGESETPASAPSESPTGEAGDVPVQNP